MSGRARELIEAVCNESDYFVTRGWWVNLSSGRSIDVSNESGPGDHFGYLIAADKGDKLFKLTPPELRALRSAVYPDWDDEEDLDDDYPFDDAHVKFTDRDMDRAFDKIHGKWLRVRVYKKHAVVQSMKLDNRTLGSIQYFFSTFRSISEITWEDYGENTAYRGVPFKDFMTSGNVNDLRAWKGRW